MRFLLILLFAAPAQAVYYSGNRLSLSSATATYVHKAGDRMTGNLTFGPGVGLSIAANKFAFHAGDSGFGSSGMYFNGAGTIDLIDLFGTTANSFNMIAGRSHFRYPLTVGAATSLTTANLELAGSANTDATYNTVWYNSDASHSMYYTNGGKFGIDNLAPSYNLDVTGNARVTSQAIFGGTVTVQGNKFSVGGSSFTVIGGTATVAYRMTVGGLVSGVGYFSDGLSTLVVGNSTAPAYTLNSNGSLGVAGLSVFGGSVAVQGQAFSVGGSSFIIDGSGLSFSTSATNRLTVSPGGDLVFTGNADYLVPTGKCAFKSQSDEDICLGFNSVGGAGLAWYDASGNQVWRMKTSGQNVIGPLAFASTFSATGSLNMPGNLTVGGAATITGSASAASLSLTSPLDIDSGGTGLTSSDLNEYAILYAPMGGGTVFSTVVVGKNEVLSADSVQNPTSMAITETANQVLIAKDDTGFTFSTPQDIATTSDVRFGKVNISGQFTTTSSGTVRGNFQVGPSTGAYLAVSAGLVLSSSTIPSISCNAGTGVMKSESTNNHGEFTAGTAAANCTLTFTRTWPKKPKCWCNNESQILLVRATPTTTTLKCDVAVSFSGDTIQYGCQGSP